MIRPELRLWAEPAAAILAIAASIWLALLGGWFFAALGLSGAVIAGIWLLDALRRRRFHRQITAPGLVELDEGAIRYYGARELGGQIALRDLVEIRLIKVSGQVCWRLRSADGQALLVPVDAAGAERMADAFAALPAMNMGRMAAAMAAIDGEMPGFQTLWTRGNQPAHGNRRDLT